MSNNLRSSREEYFGDFLDPGVSGRCEHKILDIIMIAFCGTLCGADSWVGIETVEAPQAAFYFSDLMPIYKALIYTPGVNTPVPDKSQTFRVEGDNSV